MSTAGTTHTFEKVGGILDRYGRDPQKLIPILQATQEEYRYLPEDVMYFIATSLKLAPAKVYGVATFYSHFALQPKGKYLVKVCDGTACHVKRSNGILDAVRKHLQLKGKDRTTQDQLFSVETVSCLGACGIAPVMVVNETVYGEMSPDKAVKVLADLRQQEVKA